MARFFSDLVNNKTFKKNVDEGLVRMDVDFFDLDDGRMACKFDINDKNNTDKHDLQIEFDEKIGKMPVFNATVFTAIQVTVSIDRYLQERKIIKAKSQLVRSVAAHKVKSKGKKSNKGQK